jgi:hypothetical protein
MFYSFQLQDKYFERRIVGFATSRPDYTNGKGIATKRLHNNHNSLKYLIASEALYVP